MKKILSFLLICIMLSAICFVPVSAEVYTGTLEELTFLCSDAYSAYSGFVDETGEGLFVEVYCTVDELVVFHADEWDSPALVTIQRVGNYIFTCGCIAGDENTNPIGLYVLDGNRTVYPFKFAYDTGVVTDKQMDVIASFVPGTTPCKKYEATIVEALELEEFDNGYLYDYREIYYHYSQEVTADEATPDYVLVFAVAPVVSPMLNAKRMGDYAAGHYNYYYPYDLGFFVYVPAADELYTLEQAVTEVEEIDKAFLNMGKFGGLVGDADKDGNINIKDATYIQKFIAGISVENGYMNDGELKTLIMDYDRDDDVNIKDATAIQKYIAGIKDNTAS